MEHDPIHVLDYGDFGAGKSTFAATFPKPMIVFCFDAFGKDAPYLKGGKVSDPFSDEQATWAREVTSHKTGEVLTRLEYFHDTQFIEPVEITRKAGKSVKDVIPDAYARFLRRMSQFGAEYAQWRTVVIDSVTSMEIAARRWDQFVLNPGAEDARQWFGASKDLLERMLLGRCSTLPMNVVVLAHIDDEKYEYQGKAKRMPMAPGKLRGSLGTQYSEVYRQYATDNGERLLQTDSDALWCCLTTLGAPNPCVPHYTALWPTEAK